MMREHPRMLVWFGCLIAVVAGSWLLAGPPARVGTIAFVPGVQATGRTLDEAPGLTIVSCRPTVDGLLVTGHIDTSADAAILVSPGPADLGGVGVSQGYAISAGKVAEAGLGDFQVTLAWAEEDASFAVIDPRAAAQAPRAGPAVGCPDR